MIMRSKSDLMASFRVASFDSADLPDHGLDVFSTDHDPDLMLIPES